MAIDRHRLEAMPFLDDIDRLRRRTSQPLASAPA
jgi:hypothetical protein